MSIFITGTDTNVGKTLVSAWIGLHAGYSYWKPIQTGACEETDTQKVCTLASVLSYPEFFISSHPVSPHLAAAWERRPIDVASIALPTKDPLLVEGAGGVLTPLTQTHRMIDLMERLGLPILVVTRSTLGTINHTCLTIEALRHRNLPVLGVVMSGPIDDDNREAIETYTKVPVLACLPFFPSITTEALQSFPLPFSLKEVL